MEKLLTFISCLFLLVSVCSKGKAQSDIFLKPGEFKKLSDVELERGGKIFLKSKLYDVQKDSLQFLFNISDDDNPHYLTKKYPLGEVDVLTVKNKKRKTKYGVLGGVALGVASFFLIDAITQNGDENSVKAALGQNPTDGSFEPIAGAVVGFGLGILIGETISIKRFNFKKDRKRAYYKLRQYDYH